VDAGPERRGAGRSARSGERRIPVADFLLGPFQTSLAAPTSWPSRPGCRPRRGTRSVVYHKLERKVGDLRHRRGGRPPRPVGQAPVTAGGGIGLTGVGERRTFSVPARRGDPGAERESTTHTIPARAARLGRRRWPRPQTDQRGQAPTTSCTWCAPSCREALPGRPSAGSRSTSGSGPFSKTSPPSV